MQPFQSMTKTVQTMDGQMTEPRYPCKDATQGPFSFGSSGFHIKNIYRESGSSLKKILFPELLKSEKARNSARDDACIIDRYWINTQLQHYGIDFGPNLDPFKAKALLLTSVAHGRCDAVPPQVLDIKTTLKVAYEGMMKDYREKMKAYDAQQLPKRVQKFEACVTPTEEAKCDARLFLWKYFLDEDGNPDQSRTLDLVLLPGYTDKGLALKAITEQVPALHVADGGLGGPNNVMVVGWDRARVNKKAYQIDLEQSLGGGVVRSSQDWDRQMMSHRTHVEKYFKPANSIGLKSGSSFETHNFGGKYAVNCQAIKRDWPVVSKELCLRVFHSGRLAIFDLGIVVGLMVFDKTPEDVAKLLEEGRWDSDPLDDEETNDEGEDEYASSDEAEGDDERASEPSENLFHNVGNKPDTPIDLTSGRPSKRQNIESNHPRRLHFQWRGYNTISGAIQYDPYNRNTGYLDFENDYATVLEGNIQMEALGAQIAFQGYRLPGLTGPLTLNWNSLSHLASERAAAPGYRR